MNHPNQHKNSDTWDLVIRPKNGWLDFNFRELWQYRELVWLFVKRDFVTFYKQTILGPLWYILQPLFTTLVFTIVFGKFAGIPTDGVPPFLFYLAGNIIWRYFADCLMKTSKTFIANTHLFGKVYFPRLTVPVSVVITNIFQFFIQFILFLGFYVYFLSRGASIHPNLWILALPVILFQLALLGMATGILVSSLTTRYRDLMFGLNFGIQLWMYATPIIYPLSQVPEQHRLLYACNPMVAAVESLRFAFLGTSAIEPLHILFSWLVTAALLTGGMILFSRVEKTFMDTV